MLKRSARLLGLSLLATLLLGACAPARPVPSTAIQAVLTDSAFEPGKWWVPAGQTITLSLENQGEKAHDWRLLSRPLAGQFDADDQANVLAWHTLQPGESAVITFQAPAMPGEYDVISARPGDIDQGLLGKLITVQQ